jgi:hypothetical protein
MSFDLRPLTLAELLDRSFSTYKRHVWLFVGIMAVPGAFQMVAALLLRLFNTTARRGLTPEETLRQIVPIMIGSFIFSIIYLAAYTFALGATAFAVSQLYLGRETTVGLAYRAVRPHSGRLLALMLWGTLRLVGTWFGLIILTAVLAGVLSLLSPILSGIVMVVALIGSALLVGFMAVRYGVAVPAVVLESIPGGAGLSRSVELTQGNLGRVFLLMLCAMIIAYATAAIFQGPFMMASFLAGPETPAALGLALVGALLGAVGGMFSGPIMIIGLAMMYYDLRIRKEALDLHMLLENLDAPRADRP